MKQQENEIDLKLKKHFEKISQLTNTVQENKKMIAKQAEKVGDNQQGQLPRFEKKEISEKLAHELT